MRLVECVPNFSEGKDRSVIDQIVAHIPAHGCTLLDILPDASHNRSVVTFVGSPEDVVEAAFCCVKEATSRIDMERHTGEHPRIGASDVVPIVPIEGVGMEECVELARGLGERIGRELGIPVYLYANAATRPERVRLPDVRQGEYEGLKKAILTDPDRAPDFGPQRMHPTAGATAVGARPPLIAYNVNLDTGDIVAARQVAKAIRESSGGLPSVQAKGILIKETGNVQVTMNLLDYHKTSLLTLMERLEDEACLAGAAVLDSEIVGLLPLDALLNVAKDRLGLRGFGRRQLLDLVGQAKSDDGAGDSGTSQKEDYSLQEDCVWRFIDELAAPTGAPGGGAAAAVAGALGCALVRMVAGNTLSKARFTEGRPRLEEIRKEAERLLGKFRELTTEDTQAYLAVEAAMKKPRATQEERAARREAMQEAFKGATLTPLDTVRSSVMAMALLPDLATYGNPNAVTDMAVGALLLDAARRGASMNVEINLDSLKDEEFVALAKQRLAEAQEAASGYLAVVTGNVSGANLTF